MGYEAPEPRQSRGLSGGAVAAIVVGGVLGTLALVGITVLVLSSGGGSGRRRPSGGLFGAREEASRIRCRNNLHQLGTGMAAYLNIHGDGRFYPWPGGRQGCGGSRQDARFGGAEWLASLYWTKTLTDPGIYVCPSSGDSNQNGLELGTFQCPSERGLNSSAVSYAGMGATSVAVYEREKLGRSPRSKSAIQDNFPANEPMACDDTDDPINHGRADNGGMSVLFFDTHADFWTHTKVDLERGVGRGELVALRN
jgi:hypothetical protein